MRSAVCVFARNEVADFPEWMEHHLLVGFDAVIVYDNDSDDGMSELVNQASLFLPVFRVPWAKKPGLNVQVTAYTDCLTRFGQTFDWILFIDIDEFLVCSTEQSLADLLADHASHAAIGINWVVFGSAGIQDSRGRLVMDAFLRRAPLSTPINQHIKSLVQPARARRAVNAHAFDVDGQYFGLDGKVMLFPDTEGIVAQDKIHHGDWRLHHYITRSRAHWERRAKRGAADGNPRSEEEFCSFDRNEDIDLTAKPLTRPVKRALHEHGFLPPT